MSHPAQPGPGPYGTDDRAPEPVGHPATPSGLPPRPPGPGGRIGRAYGVHVRQESQHASSNAHLSLTVLEFRLAEPGNPQPLDVLMRGRSLSGTVREGDWIELAGPPDATRRWDVATVANLTTGATVVVAGGRTGKAATVVALIVLALVLVIVAVVAIGVLASLAGP